MQRGGVEYNPFSLEMPDGKFSFFPFFPFAPVSVITASSPIAERHMGWEWIVFGAIALGITGGCLVPARWLPPLPNDKLMHFLAYGVLALMIGHLVKANAAFFLSLAVLLLASLLIEILQNFVPGRKFCWFDMMANAAGILMAALLSQLLTLL